MRGRTGSSRRLRRDERRAALLPGRPFCVGLPGRWGGGGDAGEDVVEGVELGVGHEDDGGGATVGVEVFFSGHEGREGVAAGPADLPVAGGVLGEEGEGAAGLLGVGHVVGLEGTDFGGLGGVPGGLDLLDDEAVGKGILGPFGDVGVAGSEGEDVAGVEGEGGERGGVVGGVCEEGEEQAQGEGDDGEDERDFAPDGLLRAGRGGWDGAGGRLREGYGIRHGLEVRGGSWD